MEAGNVVVEKPSLSSRSWALSCVECIVAEELLNQVEMILGMDIINMLRGVTVKEDKVQFLNSAGTIIKQKQQEAVATASENTRANKNRPTEM